MEHLAARLAEIPGVVAVTLGGSRATGEARPDSDWDFGLYYHDTIEPGDVEELGWPGEVTGPGGWGPVVNGGAWLTVEGQRVDLCYRNIEEVLAALSDAEEGRFRIEALATFVAGIPTYVLVGELALGKVLSGVLPRPDFPDALATSAPQRWRQLAAMALRTAKIHADRGDAVATVGNLSVATISEAHARLAERKQWVLNEKGIVQRAGLGAVQPLLATSGAWPEDLTATVEGVTDRLAVSEAGLLVPEAAETAAPLMTDADVSAVLAALEASGVATWVDGGWGIDALVGRTTRNHGDLDLVIAGSDRTRAEQALAVLGYEHDRQARPGLPARAVLRAGMPQVDLHLVTFDAVGNGWQPVGGGGWGCYTAEGLSGQGTVGTRHVRCITPELQLRHHLGYPPRQSDRHDLRLLADRFGLPLPPGF